MYSALHHKVVEVQNVKFLQLIFFFHILSSEIERKGKEKVEEKERKWKGKDMSHTWNLCSAQI